MALPFAARNAIEFESAEFGLRVRQNVFDRRKLQQIPWIARTEANALATINDSASQAKSHGCDAIGVGHRRYGVKVVRSHDAREIRIEARAMQGAHDLLQNDGHLLLFQAIRSGAHISLGVLAVCRRVDSLDGFRELVKPYLDVR